MPLRSLAEEASYPRDVPLWEAPTTRDKVVETLESLREVYEHWLLAMKPLNPPRETALRGSYHSLLHRLWLKEKKYGALFRPLDQILSELGKIKLLHRVGEVLPQFRPASVAIKRVPDCDWKGDLMRMLDDHGTVYVKTDKSANGAGVFRLEKVEGRLRVTPPRPLEAIIQKGVRYLVEAQIPIAPTESGETWEIRFIAPFEGLHHAKIGLFGSHVNNLSRGGRIQESAETIASVLRAKENGRPADEIQAHALVFLQQGAAVAREALQVVHDIEDRIALHIAPQALMPYFRGTFLLVDITGAWDAESGTLKPIIVECQPGGSLAGIRQVDPAGEQGLRHACTDKINRALYNLQNGLRSLPSTL